MATGTYITRSDLDNRWGARNIDGWSNLDDDQAGANETVIQDAINTAEAKVDDAFRDGRYAVPLSPTSGTLHQVKHWVSTLIGVDLFLRRTDRKADRITLMRDMAAGVMGEIAECSAGIRSLNAVRAEDDPDTPTVVHSARRSH